MMPWTEFAYVAAFSLGTILIQPNDRTLPQKVAASLLCTVPFAILFLKPFLSPE
jgi:hypothetical protein